jgi:hypothetical protein
MPQLSGVLFRPLRRKSHDIGRRLKAKRLAIAFERSHHQCNGDGGSGPATLPQKGNPSPPAIDISEKGDRIVPSHESFVIRRSCLGDKELGCRRWGCGAVVKNSTGMTPRDPLSRSIKMSLSFRLLRPAAIEN